MKIRHHIVLTVLLSFLFIQCNKEEPVDLAALALEETVTGTNIVLDGVTAGTEVESTTLTFTVDYPSPISADLSGTLQVDFWVTFDPALPAGTEFSISWAGEDIATSYTTDGSAGFWLREAFGLGRELLKDQVDHTIELMVNMPPAMDYSFTLTGYTADAGMFEDMMTRTELDAQSGTFTVGEELLDLARIETDFGDILIWLYDETPAHKANFFAHILFNFYDGLIFHRVVDEFVIQGGDPLGTGSGGPGYTIDAEIGKPHVYGAVGAARLPDSVNPLRESSGSQFYIVDDESGEPTLDGAYTVFGIVIDGMDAVEAISVVPVDADDKPLTDVVMNDVVKVQYTAAELMELFGFAVPE